MNNLAKSFATTLAGATLAGDDESIRNDGDIQEALQWANGLVTEVRLLIDAYAPKIQASGLPENAFEFDSKEFTLHGVGRGESGELVQKLYLELDECLKNLGIEQRDKILNAAERRLRKKLRVNVPVSV